MIYQDYKENKKMKIRVIETIKFSSGEHLCRELEILDTEKMEDLITLLHIGDTSNTNDIRLEEIKDKE